MGVYADKLAQLQVTVTSPDKSVTLRYADHRIGIEFADSAIAHHTESTLGRQISAAARGALAGYQRGLRVAADEVLTEDREALADIKPSPLMQRYAEQRGDIAAIGRSSKDYVKVRRTSKEGIDLRIRPGALQQLSEQDLASEVCSALAAAMRDNTRQLQQLRREIFGADAA
jgi:hypothetical protein